MGKKKQVTPTPAPQFEMVLWVPTKTAGEVGETLHPTIIKHISKLADLGWWPLSFGEEGSEEMPDHVQLWFAFDPKIAMAQAIYFIDHKGE